MSLDKMKDEIERRLGPLGAESAQAWSAQAAVPGYLDVWARNLARAVSKAELKQLRAAYAARGRDKRLSEDDRAMNRERAKALRKYV